MFREIRRKKNEIPLEAAKELLRNNRRAAFAVNGDDGYPYAIPINFYYEESENKIYFHGAKGGHKLDAILRDPKVCLTTWDDGVLEEGDWAYHVSSCVVFGKLCEHFLLFDTCQRRRQSICTVDVVHLPPEETFQLHEQILQYDHVFLLSIDGQLNLIFVRYQIQDLVGTSIIVQYFGVVNSLAGALSETYHYVDRFFLSCDIVHYHYLVRSE